MNHAPPILDVRPEVRFLAGHAPGAANVPLEDLAWRSHELPPKGAAVRVFDEDADRACAAALDLRQRGYLIEIASLSAADFTETGPARTRLWQPSPLLTEALELIASIGREETSRALDVACGSGREAVALALAGWEVDALDVLPDALDRARDLARRSGVNINTVPRDLRQPDALPAAAYDLVTVFRFLHRPALPMIGDAVAPDGFLIYEAFNRRNLGGSHDKPLKPARLLDDGELSAAFPDFEIFMARDGVEREGRVFSQLVARRRR
jgi:tellurite methyltransferase